MIEIVPYNSEWPQHFVEVRAFLEETFAGMVARIDHIGSTAVPGLSAKDKIDIQITLPSDENELVEKFELAAQKAGFGEFLRWEDHRPPGDKSESWHWQKFFLRSANLPVICNIHVRIQGRRNQRYPLLFRDYLRAHKAEAAAYAAVKVQLAKYHPENIEAYCEIKDPVCDLIMNSAEKWAVETNWDEKFLQG